MRWWKQWKQLNRRVESANEQIAAMGFCPICWAAVWRVHKDEHMKAAHDE